MKRRIVYLYFAGLIWLPIISLAQLDVLQNQLQGKTSLSEISTTVEQYLASAPESPEKDKFEKHYYRWALYQSLHLGPNGEFVNVAKKTFEAVANKVQTPNSSTNGLWSFVGPTSSPLGNSAALYNGVGRIDRIAFHPTSAGTIYVGTPAGGLWKTTNYGSSWLPISNYIPSLGISGIVVDHADPNTIYVLTGDGDSYLPAGGLVTNSGYQRFSLGVVVTHDGGVTWEKTGELSTEDELLAFRLVQHPTNANILLAATSDGIYRTINAGVSWIQEIAGQFYDIEFKPGAPSRVYASGVSEFVYSTNTGASWNTDATFDEALCGSGRVEIAVTPNSPSKVVLLAGPKMAGNTFCGLYHSYNSGSDFYRKANTPNVFGQEDGSSDQSGYDMGVAVSPTNHNIVITAGLIIFKSSNGGVDFANVTAYNENGTETYIHPDVHDVAYNPLNGNLYAATDGGFYESTDDGTTWTDILNGVNTTQFYHMDDYDANKYAMFAGSQDNGLKYKTSSSSAFQHVYCCDGYDVAIDYTDQTKGYGVINGHLLEFSSFTGSAPTSVNGTGFFKQVELHSSDPSIVYYSKSRIYEYDGSSSTLLGDWTISGYWALRTCPSNSTRLYAAGGSSLFSATGTMVRSNDNGANWTNISDSPGFPSEYPRISAIGVRPNSSQTVYAVFSGYTDNLKVYYSYDVGASWTNVSYDLPNIPVWSIEVDNSNNVYIGTDYGVFYKASGATNWEPFYNGLPNVPISDLAINIAQNQLLASTFGRGIWKSDLRTPCPPNLYIYGNLDGLDVRTASNSITMYGDVIGGDGTSVYLRSENYVDLKPGFKANGDGGTDFLAYIGDCDIGIPPAFTYGNPADTAFVTSSFTFSLNRNLGTLEVQDVSATEKKVITRLFTGNTSQVKVFLTKENGQYIKDIADFAGQKGKTEYTVQTADLDPGLYYLYLGIGNDINHLQELYIH